MVCLSETKYPMESGLQSIFQEENNNRTRSYSWWIVQIGLENKFKEIEEKYNTTLYLLLFSVFWSFKTCAKTSVKIKTETKKILPLFPKLLLFVRYLFIFQIRVASIIAYYAPYIGLIGLMNHYRAETIHLNPNSWNNFNSDSKCKDLQIRFIVDYHWV